MGRRYLKYGEPAYLQGHRDRYYWVVDPSDPSGKKMLRRVGVLADGSVWNPEGHDEQLLRQAVAIADVFMKEKRHQAAMKASETRRRRHDINLDKLARKYLAGNVFGPQHNCACCDKALTDQISILRGIGSECWGHLMSRCETLKAEGRPSLEPYITP
jgi:hypothetical protein